MELRLAPLAPQQSWHGRRPPARSDARPASESRSIATTHQAVVSAARPAGLATRVGHHVAGIDGVAALILLGEGAAVKRTASEAPAATIG